ncbi:Type VI secretion system-associated FHA domain protein TagH [Paramixta manurensis]|uniref:Type VI secretion system-associated FHA domain protein TagH n=1 Tax=Paramixta manurensis TaxID=2740817 RepID=A0A6M8UFX5_9GAMM|nr:Type VI secretion system-associated FHA domain protein TagH [Erwiniaceae bacterium PD-1]
MRFTIITNKAGHQPPQSSCDFLSPGGTIGRGIDNNLVLPDDDRTISRLQAIVHITADGECRITNRGNVTRVVLNDIPLERGRQVDLQDGDILGIDDYRLQVSDLNSPVQPVPRPVAAQPAPQPTAKPAAAESGPAAIPSEIWDSLAQEFSISDNLSSRTKPVTPAAAHNPLTEQSAANRNPEDPLAQFRQQDTPDFDQRKPTPDSLFNDSDELFKSDSIFDDSTPTTLLQQPAEKPQKPAAPQGDELDPLALFGGGHSPAKINSDDPLGLMMGGAVPLAHPDDAVPGSQMKTSPQQQQPIIPPAPPKMPSEPLPDANNLFGNAADVENSPLFGDASSLADSPLFADEPPAEATTPPTPEPIVPLPEEPVASARPVSIEDSPLFNDAAPSAPQPDYGGITLPTPQAVQRTNTPPPKGRLRIDPVASSAQASSAQPSNGEALQGELLQALIDGMGLNDMQPVPHFDRDNMQQLGQMLSMFSQGTVALLSSRSILKRGVKADMTVILDDANNPFKLLPSGKTVLMQMFGSRMPGFMPPKQAVRDALVDLQAHQLGMIAGIRAIIASMLQSFNPEQLEEEAREEGMTSRLSLPGSRKAALWEHFTRRYNQTAGEIEDDFHTLFGEAFLHAYDMEVNQYKDSQTRSEE